MRDRDRDVRRPRRDRDDRDRKDKKFTYRRRDASTFKDQANQKGGNYDRTYKSQYKVLRVEAGKSYQIRILPPTWEDPQHFAFDRWQHSGVGPDNQRYNCLRQHKGEGCPVCEEEAELKKEAQQESDPKEAKALSEAAYKAKAKLRKVMWVIDRDNEKDGPIIWDPSWVVNRDLSGRCVNERTGAVLYIDDPDNGYDITFKGEKKGQYVEIISIEVARQSTPISDDQDQQDEWLEFANDNPIPETLEFYSYEHITKTLSGGRVKKDEDEGDEEDGPRTRSERRRRDEDDEDEQPRSKRSSLRDEDEDDMLDDDEDDDPKGRAKSRRDEPDDDDDDLDEPRSRRRNDEDVEDEDEDEDDRPRSRRQRDDDEDDDKEGGRHVRKISRKRSSSDEGLEGDDDEPSSRRDSDRDERSDRNKGRRSSRDRSSTEDDEDGREDVSTRRKVKRRRDDDDLD